jgi:uncharacterized protein
LTELLTASGLTLHSLIIAALMTFGAAYIRGLTGFGMAIILVPLLGIIIRPEQAVILAIFLQFLIGPVSIRTSLRHAEKPSSFIIAVAAVVATPLGLWLLSITPSDLARVLIAAVAIGAFLLVIMPKRAHGRPGMPMTIATGLSAGLLTGFAAMPGPPVVPYYLQHDVEPLVARSSMMTIFFATAITGTIISIASGFGSVALAAMSLLLLIPMLLGNWLGAKAFGKVSPALWRSIVGLVLGIAGISAVLRAIS